jgi:hypothetical protein
MVYRTWGKRCVWCKRPITYRSLEIDHLVPKSLAGGELNRALADYGLPASFDIYALPNLVPSCRPCNGSKGDRPVRGAPIVVAVLDKAQQRAPEIRGCAAKFNRSSALDEVTALLHAIQPTADEMKSLNELVEVGRRSHLAFTCYEPDPPKLKRSKNRLGYNGFSDKRQMLMMLESWVTSNNDLTLDVVQDTFDGGDTPPQNVWLTSVNFLAYAEEIGDFLANVTFNVDYLFVTEDSSGPADAEHDVDLWITLDPTKQSVVDVVPDNLNTLHLCDGYLTSSS